MGWCHCSPCVEGMAQHSTEMTVMAGMPIAINSVWHSRATVGSRGEMAGWKGDALDLHGQKSAPPEFYAVALEPECLGFPACDGLLDVKAFPMNTL